MERLLSQYHTLPDVNSNPNYYVPLHLLLLSDSNVLDILAITTSARHSMQDFRLAHVLEGHGLSFGNIVWRADLAKNRVHSHTRERARKITNVIQLHSRTQRRSHTLDAQRPQETREGQYDTTDVRGISAPMPSVKVPVPSVGIGRVEIGDEVVSFSNEEVIAEHDADETAHEDSHAGDAG